MSKRSFFLAFVLGLASVAWVGWGFAGASWLALAMTAVIGGVFLLGAWELHQYRAGTAGLAASLADMPQPVADLDAWLAQVPPALRNTVRLRVEGERAALPGPALTPYLVGLLVMLGMLGTFLGMVVTFNGAVFALEGSADLQAMRSALAAPIKGLGLSFGTSVAGVAASAMLGLMSAIARRERQDAGRLLDSRIAGVLQPHSLVHQRQETFRALQAQSRALPEVAQKLDALMERIEQRSRALDERLAERQQQFHREVTQAYTELARTVGASLNESLAASARAAGDSIRPVVESAMAQVVLQAERTHERLGQGATRQADALARTFEERSATLLAGLGDTLARTQAEQARAEQQRVQAWTEALQAMAADLQAQWQRAADAAIAQQQAVSRALETTAGDIAERTGAQAHRALDEVQKLIAQSGQALHARTEAAARFEGQNAQRMDELATLWRAELAALRQQESERGDAAVARLGELEAAVARHLATLGAALEAPITRLLRTASEVPEAAAGVITQLREEMHRVAERDNLALQERTALLERFGALLATVNDASGQQRDAITALVASASSVLEGAATRFGEALAAQSTQATDSAAYLAAGAVELGSVAEAFGQGVQAFQASSDRLAETLQRIEASLVKSTARSDEQLAYYVAQAREVIDLSIASQQGVLENLRQLQARPAKAAAVPEGAGA